MSPTPTPQTGRHPALPQGLSFWSPPALIATWFGTGLLPKAPGTWGAMAALPVAWVLALRIGPWAVLAAAGVLFLAGLWAAKAYLAHAREDDPGPVVIDEVAAQLLVLAPAALDPLDYALGFLLFRLFDIMKPWPIKEIERRLPGALGVMADDIAAAIYASICLGVYFVLSGRPHVFF
ncbi:MAG: phosphatidylglycerophosphatase A [Alphaproteobacteria bacterium]|nr:phosphatidylglycerophosphatase A [Alphaproteobacteria bacterium]